MPIPTDPAAGTGLPSDTNEVVAFLRSPRATMPEREPSQQRRLNLAGAIDGCTEAQAMIGLAALASESLPGPHALQFGCLLELIEKKLGVILAGLREGHGQPPLEPVEA